MAISRPEASASPARILAASWIRSRLSTSNTGLGGGISAGSGSSPRRISTLRTPMAEAPSRSAWSAIRLRSRQVNWRIGSIPAPARMAAPASADMWTIARGPSVTLSASTRPRNGSAASSSSPGAPEAGGTSSAVIANSPFSRVRANPDSAVVS